LGKGKWSGAGKGPGFEEKGDWYFTGGRDVSSARSPQKQKKKGKRNKTISRSDLNFFEKALYFLDRGKRSSLPHLEKGGSEGRNPSSENPPLKLSRNTRKVSFPRSSPTKFGGEEKGKTRSAK